jgi:hypothetical protein
MPVPIDTLVRIDADGYCVRGVYKITRFDTHCEGSLVGPDGQVVPDKPCKITGYRGPFGTPEYDPVDARRPATRFSYCAKDIETLIQRGDAVPLEDGEEVGPIPESNRGAW